MYNGKEKNYIEHSSFFCWLPERTLVAAGYKNEKQKYSCRYIIDIEHNTNLTN